MARELQNIFADLNPKLDEIVLFENHIQEIFTLLKNKDPKNGEMIEQALISVVKDCSDKIASWVEQNKNGLSRTKRLSAKVVFALENLKDTLESIANEVKARISPFITYSETMARRRADLQAFAMETEEKFLMGVLDKIEILFDEKRGRLFEKIDREFGVRQRLNDALLSPLEKGVKWLAKQVNLKPVAEGKWDQTWLEEIIETELGQEVLERQLREIFKKAQDEFQKAWEKKASETPPDLKVIQSFIGSTTKDTHLSIPLHLDISTSVLTSGLGVSIAAVAGLAAGWHTLEYALANRKV